MNRAQALGTLRRTLEAFHGERKTVRRPNGSVRHGPVVMVARLSPEALTNALNALAELERGEEQDQ